MLSGIYALCRSIIICGVLWWAQFLIIFCDKWHITFPFPLLGAFFRPIIIISDRNIRMRLIIGAYTTSVGFTNANTISFKRSLGMLTSLIISELTAVFLYLLCNTQFWVSIQTNYIPKKSQQITKILRADRTNAAKIWWNRAIFELSNRWKRMK